jgi:hypothetical protein
MPAYAAKAAVSVLIQCYRFDRENKPSTLSDSMVVRQHATVIPVSGQAEDSFDYAAAGLASRSRVAR